MRSIGKEREAAQRGARAAAGGSNIVLTCMRERVARVRLHRVPETIRTYTDMITK